MDETDRLERASERAAHEAEPVVLAQAPKSLAGLAWSLLMMFWRR
jgi:hypothetical protein